VISVSLADERRVLSDDIYMKGVQVNPSFLAKFNRTRSIIAQSMNGPSVRIKANLTISEAEAHESAKPSHHHVSAKPKTAQPQSFRVVGTAKPKFRRSLPSTAKKSDPKAPTFSQADIPVERCLRRLGSNLKTFSRLDDKIEFKMQHQRSLSQQFISDFELPRRSNSELRMHQLSHILQAPLSNFKVLDTRPIAVPFGIKPSTAPARRVLQSRSGMSVSSYSSKLGAKITDASYNLLLQRALDLILRLTAEVKCENFYEPRTQAITSVLSGQDAPQSDCCQSSLQVKFTELYGCKVVCTKPDCLSKTVTNFLLPLLLRQKLWETRPLVQQPMSPRQVSLTIATGKHRSFSFRNASASIARRRSSMRQIDPSQLNLAEEEPIRIFSNERLKSASHQEGSKQRYSTNFPSKLLLPHRKFDLASNPLQVMLARHRGPYSPAVRLQRRGFSLSNAQRP
jgi:hypothetical protein